MSVRRLCLTDLFLSLTVSGAYLPPVLVGVSNKIAVNFHSDSWLSDCGVSVRWEAVYAEDIAGKIPASHPHIHQPPLMVNPAGASVHGHITTSGFGYLCVCALMLGYISEGYFHLSAVSRKH